MYVLHKMFYNADTIADYLTCRRASSRILKPCWTRI